VKPLRGLGFAVLIVALYTFGYAWRDLQAGKVPDEKSMRALFGLSVASPPAAPDQQVKQAFQSIQTSYYRTVKPMELKYAGMMGLMASLGDPHTVFLEPRIAEDFQTNTTANFVGVGARLSKEEGLGAKAVAVFEDGPAYRAGFRVNDVVIAVDGKPVGDLPIDEIVSQIKGVEGTTVELSVLRGGSGKPLTLKIRRAQITIPTVEAKVFEKERIGYLNVTAFSEPTAEQFDRGMEKVLKSPIRGLIIDMRGNPGGLLDAAVDLLSRFAEANKVVVKMRARGEAESVARTYGGVNRQFRYPIAILIDEDSASAAEIFAGAMRDYQLATLVGEHTYGKSSVQQLFPLRDSAFAKITVARYFLPGGEDIARKVDPDGVYLKGGLQPDVKVEVPLDQVIEPGQPDKDPMLKRAIEILSSR